MYAHGANGSGWSTAHTFNLSIAAVSATAGFSAAGGYPSGGAVTSPNTPQIGADADTTFGNAFTYVIKNTSGAGNNLTSAVITVPGKDASFVLPADGTAWTITGAPVISGAAYGCSITSYTSAQTNGTNGAINIGGGTCSITPGSTLTIKFTAKAPYTVNDTYTFPTKVNGAIAASEQWSTDSIVQIYSCGEPVDIRQSGQSGPRRFFALGQLSGMRVQHGNEHRRLGTGRQSADSHRGRCRAGERLHERGNIGRMEALRVHQRQSREHRRSHQRITDRDRLHAFRAGGRNQLRSNGIRGHTDDQSGTAPDGYRHRTRGTALAIR